jgi:pimeloyl-ACP methyl ester carboxylesterase
MVQVDSTKTPTLFVECGDVRYAYRRFGRPAAVPLLCLQHFTGTLDNWDPALTDALAADREVILSDNAGVGRSTGLPASTVEGMAEHVFAFVKGLGIGVCDILGFSLGGMVAQQLALTQPSGVRRLVLVGTAPRGGEDIMHFERPVLAQYFSNPSLQGLDLLQKIFFAPSESSQAAGAAFIERIKQRVDDREPISGQEVAQAQMAAFRAWEEVSGERFAELRKIAHPALVMNGVHDEMIPVRNSYWLVENLPNAVLLVYPDAGHGSLFQFHGPFSRQVAAFLDSKSAWAPY